MSEIQEQIQRHIDTLVGTGAETGVQVVVYQDGALIVDAVAGTADPATGRSFTSGTAPLWAITPTPSACRGGGPPATGRPMGELLREWITAPLGIEGLLYFAAPKESPPQLARLEQTRPWPVRPDDGNAILAPWENQPSADFGNKPEILHADIPSVGVATAHGHPARMGLGFPIDRIGPPAAENSLTFGRPGGGGSYAYAHRTRGVAFALTKTPSRRGPLSFSVHAQGRNSITRRDHVHLFG